MKDNCLTSAEAAAYELLEALRECADKMDDLREWLTAFAETKQAASVEAIRLRAVAAIALAEKEEVES